MAFPTDRLPKRYYVDESGRQYLVGLSVEETFEFETLGEGSPLICAPLPNGQNASVILRCFWVLDIRFEMREGYRTREASVTQ